MRSRQIFLRSLLAVITSAERRRQSGARRAKSPDDGVESGARAYHTSNGGRGCCRQGGCEAGALFRELCTHIDAAMRTRLLSWRYRRNGITPALSCAMQKVEGRDAVKHVAESLRMHGPETRSSILGEQRVDVFRSKVGGGMTVCWREQDSRLDAHMRM